MTKWLTWNIVRLNFHGFGETRPSFSPVDIFPKKGYWWNNINTAAAAIYRSLEESRKVCGGRLEHLPNCAAEHVLDGRFGRTGSLSKDTVTLVHFPRLFLSTVVMKASEVSKTALYVDDVISEETLVWVRQKC
jgi:hypothetical protein